LGRKEYRISRKRSQGGKKEEKKQRKNRFLLTGSSSLELIKNVSESLAGRVGLAELGTFKANETYALDLPEFYKIFTEKLSKVTIDYLKGLKPVLSHNQESIAESSEPRRRI